MSSDDGYAIWSKIPAEQTRRDIAETFRKWGDMRGSRAEFVIGHDKRTEGALIDYRLAPDPSVNLSHDRQGNFRSNLRVLYLAVEAMRMNEKRGIADAVREAYLALPAPAKVRDPWEVLGLRSDADPVVVEATYRALAKQRHPDAGGDPEAFKELQAAYEAVKR